MKLVFNADVSAAEARPFLYFQDSTGVRIPAEVRQCTAEECPGTYAFGWVNSLETWAAQFAEAGHSPRSRSRRYDEATATNDLGNILVVTSRQALPVGRDWELVIREGLPAQDPALSSRVRARVPVGDVTPFVVSAVTVQHTIHSVPRVQVQFSKAVSSSVTNNIADWIEISPSPAELQVQLYDRTLLLSGGFESHTSYRVLLGRGLPAEEPFTLAGSNMFTVTKIGRASCRERVFVVV